MLLHIDDAIELLSFLLPLSYCLLNWLTTFDKADNDVLIWPASRSLSPEAPVCDAFSDPARSTKLRTAEMILLPGSVVVSNSSWLVALWLALSIALNSSSSKVFMVILRIVWDRELWEFIRVSPSLRSLCSRFAAWMISLPLKMSICSALSGTTVPSLSTSSIGFSEHRRSLTFSL